jgi:general stress protein 26
MDGIIRWLALLWRRFAMRRTRTDVAAVLAAARTTIKRKAYCLLITHGPGGQLAARVLQPAAPEGDPLVIWLGTDPRTRKVQEIRANPRATLVYQDDGHSACVVLKGEISLVEDAALRNRYFRPTWWAFMPQGPNQDFVLLKFTPHQLEVLDFSAGITPAPFGMQPAVLVRHNEAWVQDHN